MGGRVTLSKGGPGTSAPIPPLLLSLLLSPDSIPSAEAQKLLVGPLGPRKWGAGVLPETGCSRPGPE